MILNVNAKAYVQLLEANLNRCEAIVREDRYLVSRRVLPKDIWLVQRAPVEDTAEGPFEDERAYEPMRLVRGGQVELSITVRENAVGGTEAFQYRIAFLDLPTNDNGVCELRYDRPSGKPQRGWEDDLGDNPEHPWCHLHVNYRKTEAANDLRLVTAPICPITLLRSFSYWYGSQK